MAPFVRVFPYENKAFLTKRKVIFTMKVVSNVFNIHLGVYNDYQNFHPLIFYGHTRLRGVGADLPPPPGGNRGKVTTFTFLLAFFLGHGPRTPGSSNPVMVLPHPKGEGRGWPKC